MIARRNDDAGRQSGVKTQHQANIIVDHAANGAENRPKPKPDLDLLSWSKLGASVKPSRDRRPKSSWKRGQR